MNAIDNELSPLRIPDLEDELTAVLCAAISWGGSVISSEEYVAAKRRFRAAVNAAIEAALQSQDREDSERLDFIEKAWFYQNPDGVWSFGFNECWDAGQHNSLRDAIDHARRIEGGGE